MAHTSEAVVRTGDPTTTVPTSAKYAGYQSPSRKAATASAFHGMCQRGVERRLPPVTAVQRWRGVDIVAGNKVEGGARPHVAPPVVCVR